TRFSRDWSSDVSLPIFLALVEAGAHKILRVGGAQSIAALAYGTESVPQVDKIVGPGNLFVQLAKGLVFGTVGIDSLAGPSEILKIGRASCRDRGKNAVV